ncbi:hypothetical protein TNCV_3723811 [Trichonephila clavipes]|nr:hypothetical protein TNCV_3723811 [Trichonephila clavipes]
MSRRPRLIDEDHDNSSHRKNNAPDEGIWSAVVGLKKRALMQISHFSRNCCREYRQLRIRKCALCTMVHQHIFRFRCITMSMLHTQGSGPDVLPLHCPDLELLLQGPLEIVCV